MENYLVILDNGHGQDTSGKRSPKWKDGSQLFEYEFNRDIVRRIAKMLKKEGIEYKILVPEVIDISLQERCRRANHVHQMTGGKCFLLSIHANAGGGKGWEAWTSVGQTKSDEIAMILYNQFERDFKGVNIRKDMKDGDPDKESQFFILKHTKCAAVLSENFFMDTESDCRFIMQDEARERIARTHVEAIKKTIQSVKL